MKKTKESTSSYAALHDHRLNLSSDKNSLARTRPSNNLSDSERSSITLKSPSPLVGKDSPSLNKSQPFQGQNELLDTNKSHSQSYASQKSFSRDQHISCSSSQPTNHRASSGTAKSEITDTINLLKDQLLSRKLAVPALRPENASEELLERSTSPMYLQNRSGEKYMIDETLLTPEEESSVDQEYIHNIRLIFEGRSYTVHSNLNDIKPQKLHKENRSCRVTPNNMSVSNTSVNKNNISWSTDCKRNNPETNIIGLKDFRLINDSCEGPSNESGLPQDLNAFLEDQIIVPNHKEKVRYRELVSVDSDVYNYNSGVSRRGVTSKTIEERYMFNNDGAAETDTECNTLKKHLSVIFSTGKSMDVSVDSRDSRYEEKSPADHSAVNQDVLTPRQVEMAIVKEESATEEVENVPASEPLPIVEDENDAVPAKTETKVTEIYMLKAQTGINGEKETIDSIVQSLRLQNKGNKDLDEALLKVLSIYEKQVRRYEEKLKMKGEKCERYRDSNQTLLDMIKSWEQEVDKLATTNKNLHDIIVGLEDKGAQSQQRETELISVNDELKLEIQNLKEEALKDSADLQSISQQLSSKNEEVDTLALYSRQCEDLIQMIGEGLKPLVSELSDKGFIERLKKFTEKVVNRARKLEFGDTYRFKSLKDLVLELTNKEKLLIEAEISRISLSNNNMLKTAQLETTTEESSSSFDKQFDNLKKFNSVDMRPKTSNISPVRSIQNQKSRQELYSSAEGLMSNSQLDKPNSRKHISPTCKSIFDLKNKFSALHTPFLKKKTINSTQRNTSEDKKLSVSTLTNRPEQDLERSPERDNVLSMIQERKRDKSAPEKKDAGRAKIKKI